LNLLFVILCSFIPIIGPIVLAGYFFEVIDALLRRGWRGRDGSSDDYSEAITVEPIAAVPRAKSVRAAESDAITAEPPVVLSEDEHTPPAPYPDFTFERFTEYLARGVWPFLVSLVVNLPVGLCLGLVMYIGMIALFLAGQHSGVAVALGMCALVFLYVFVLAVMAIVSKPFYLRAGLSRDFASAFSMTFFRDFLSRVGKEVVLATLFLAGTGTILMIAGVLACYIGLFPAVALLMFAQHHIDYQLYALYLERGGTPVEPKPTRERDREPRYD
jgi:hypothetical protein